MRNWSRRSFLKTSLAASAADRLLPGAETSPPNRKETPAVNSVSNDSARERLLLDFGWRFHLGDANDPSLDFAYGRDMEYAKTGEFFVPSRPDFDDSAWRTIDLPHDWAVELPFQELADVEPLEEHSNGRIVGVQLPVNGDPWLITHGSKPLGRTYPATSIGWYRREFEIPASDLGKRLSLEFDGVFRDSMAALNGNFLGRNMSGYAPFRYDITDHAHYGGKNVVVLRVDATEYEGWFYEGAGIYRHVWLVKTNPVHVPQWGVYVTSNVSEGSATLSIATEVANEADTEATCQVVSSLLDAEGNHVENARSESLPIPAWQRREIKQQVSMSAPKLWSLESPYLYRVVTMIEAGGKTLDRTETPFGIRTIRFDPDKGFFLNGKPVKIKGTCNHQDHAGVGSALPDRLQSYRIEKLKEMGANGYRTSHNPPTPELLDACDRLGMLVMDETRMFNSDPEGLSQLSRMVRRDRNHPCIVLWSTGNEEPEQGTARGARICATMKRLVRRLDPTRPITQAMNGAWGKGISAVVDVQGFNYHLAPAIDAFHAKFPNEPCVGSEVGSTVSTRGIYVNDAQKGYVSAYDVNHPPWATTAEVWWQIFDARPFLSGGFVWTGFDYRGEPTPYGWPDINSNFGIVDTCGFPKDNFYYYQAWWSGRPVLHLFPHWNWPGKEGQEIDVWCHSNLERIELFLNGKSLGAQKMERNSHVAWKVNYTPGVLEARGYRDGRVVLSARRETTGEPARIVLVPDRREIMADREDASVVEVRIVDSQGKLMPVAANDVTFEITGPGNVIGVGNGNPSSHEADKASHRRAFNGLCVAIVQSTKESGSITLQASSPSLDADSVVIRSLPATPRPAVP